MSTPYSLKERKAWGAKMAEARAAKAATPVRRVVTRKPMRPRPKSIVPKVSYAKGRTIVGRGEYKEKTKYSNVGERVGSTIGAGLGKGIHQLVKHITGFGDYNVEQNSLMDGGLSPPQIVNASSHGGVIVRHREYLGDINASTAFSLTSYPLNPGLEGSFPWLSRVAGAYEQYKWRGVVFEVNSLSSDAILSASTSSALGSVIMATEYNSLASVFANKSEMENHEFSNSRKPSLNFMHPIECKQSLTSVDLLYVRTGAVPVNADIRLYDLGKTQIATVGMQAAAGVACELHVTYEVELYKPTISTSPAPIPEGGYADHFQINTSLCSGANPFGTSAVLPLTGSNLGGYVNYALNTYYFAPEAMGRSFGVYYSIIGTAALLASPGLSIYGAAPEALYGSGRANLTLPGNAVSSTGYTFLQFVTVATNAAYFQIPASGTLPTAANVNLFVFELPTALEQLKGLIEDVTDSVDDNKSIEDDSQLPEVIKRYLAKKGIQL